VPFVRFRASAIAIMIAVQTVQSQGKAKKRGWETDADKTKAADSRTEHDDDGFYSLCDATNGA
jgi:hypothetical protein